MQLKDHDDLVSAYYKGILCRGNLSQIGWTHSGVITSTTVPWLQVQAFNKSWHEAQLKNVIEIV